ncbi:MAG: prevent-host-death protein [Dysgonamonadaceae bacterium]|jgi:hypothetical protein|nr:prevent-host-death protein [Dysgonamonadaceae bacterium]
MLVVSTRELTQNQEKYFDIAKNQRLIIKRKNRFFQIVDLGETIPEIDDAYMSRKELYSKLDKGIEEYKAGKTKTFASKEDIHKFLNAL